MNKDSKLLAEAYDRTSRGMRPITSNYIYFIDSDDLYQAEDGAAFKLIGKKVEALKMLPKLDVQGWDVVKIAVGEDIAELTSQRIDMQHQSDRWFVVDDSFPADHSHKALISK